MTWDATSIVLLLGTIGGFSTAANMAFQARATRRRLTGETGRISAEAAQVISNSAVALLRPMEDTIERMQIKLRETEHQLDITTRDLKDTTRKLNLAMDRVGELESMIQRIRKENELT